MKTESVRNFIKNKKEISIPEIQKKFSVDYFEAAAAMRQLLNDNLVEFKSGISYKICEMLVHSPFSNTNFFRSFGEARRIVESSEERSERDEIEELDDIFDDEDKVDNKKIFEEHSDISESDSEPDIEELGKKALKICLEQNQASVSLIQRSLDISFIQSCKVMDWLENKGYISEAQGIKPRKVLISLEEYNKTFGDDGHDLSLSIKLSLINLALPLMDKVGEGQTYEIHINDEAEDAINSFSVGKKDAKLYFSDRGKILTALNNSEVDCKKIIFDFGLVEEDGEIRIYPKKCGDIATTFMRLYAASEIVNRLIKK